MKRLAIPLSLLAVVLAGCFLLRHSQAVNTVPCPVSLTNPDGQSLNLEKYDLRVAVHGPLSLTEMEMVFRNPENRVMEGRFLYLLPPGATISRFAKEVNGQLMEGEVVERMRAQAVYTQILHEMRDPALLEMDQGNRFSARVFPIPANGTVRLLLSYSQVLPLNNGERRMVIPMLGMPTIGEFTFNAVIRKLPSETVTFTSATGEPNAPADDNARMSIPALKNFTPQRDMELAFRKKPDSPRVSALKAGDYQMLCFQTPPNLKEAERRAPEWVLYFDTSASNADTEAQRLGLIEALLPRDGKGLIERNTEASVEVNAFDIEVAQLYNGRISAFGSPTPNGIQDGRHLNIRNMLERRHQLGATNLEAALKHMGERAREIKEPRTFVLVSDGIATYGKREISDLLAALGDWPAQHTLHALVIGSKQDQKVLTAITEKGLGRVVSLPFTDNNETAVKKAVEGLTMPLGESLGFYDEGAEWMFPKTFRDVQPGQEVIVFSQIKAGGKSDPGVFPIDHATQKPGKSEELKAAPADLPDFAPLLQREACAAKLSYLEQREQELLSQVAAGEAQTKRGINNSGQYVEAAKWASELRKERLELSVKSRVLCPLTSLLVLESEADYQRFGIERTALADIMQIGQAGIELKKRDAESLPAMAVKAPKPAAARKGGDLKKAAQKAELEEKGKKEADRIVESRNGLKDAKADSDEEALEGNANGVRLERLASTRDDAMDGDRGDSNRLRSMDEAAPARSAGARELQQQQEQAGQSGGQRGPLNAPAGEGYGSGTGVAPAATVAPASPEPQRDQAAQNAAERRNDPARVVSDKSVPVVKPLPAPEWIKQYGYKPSDTELETLRAQVAARPRDRALRNLYSDALYKAEKWDSLQGQCFEWMPFDPENPQVYEYLAKSAANLGDAKLALRAITSIDEIAPNRAALLARAGWLSIAAKQNDMAAQMFREALKNRTDDCNIYRGLALSLWLDGKLEDAAKVYCDALKQKFNGRYGDTRRVLREELCYVVRALAKADKPAAEGFILQEKLGDEMLRADALRVTLCWETDANDVDLHVADPNNEVCFYNHKKNASGLELYSDQTQGLGPEVIRCDKAMKGAYHVAVNYFSAGAMGVSRGVVVVMQPKDGLVEKPQVVPFCLVPGRENMRHLAAAKFEEQ